MSKLNEYGESSKVAGYFAEYAAMGPSRSLARLRVHLGKQSNFIRQLETYSSRYDWQRRVRSYDARVAEQEREKREVALREQQLEHEQAIFKMNTEHALLGRTHALRAAKQIQELIEAKRFGSQAAVTLFTVATNLERVARGAETQNTRLSVETESKANTIAFDLSKVSLEQLEQLEALAGAIEHGDP